MTDNPIASRGERMTGVDGPLLTIAIPTWNRSSYLSLNLSQLAAEARTVPEGTLEVVVSDNCSSDDTPAVVEHAVEGGLPIRYLRNQENVGWAKNFAQAFEAATGKYVLLLGDDDLLTDGALALLIRNMREREFGVLCMRPYGFDVDFRSENPGGTGGDVVFEDANRFLVAISRWFTLTSACVVNKSLLTNVDVREFISTNLAVFHLLLRAALAAKQNVFVNRYLLASKRQNSFSYDYAEVFVGELWRIIDAHVRWGLRPDTVRRIERDKLLSYYPFYLFDLVLARRADPRVALAKFGARFGDRVLFKYWLAPIVRLPRPLGIAWGAMTTVVGRIMDGDARRGAAFAWNRLKRMLQSRTETILHGRTSGDGDGRLHT